jgi:radical SAM superfamily enzyme YgiQ (UPF0313 family)
VFRETKEAGIAILAYFMIGSPGETREQMRESLRLARELAPDYMHLSITTPFPETDLYRMGFEKGVLTEDYWRAFARNPQKGFIPKVWEEHCQGRTCGDAPLSLQGVLPSAGLYMEKAKGAEVLFGPEGQSPRRL